MRGSTDTAVRVKCFAQTGSILDFSDTGVQQSTDVLGQSLSCECYFHDAISVVLMYFVLKWKVRRGMRFRF